MEVITHRVMEPRIRTEFVYCCDTLQDMVENGPITLGLMNKMELVYYTVASVRRTRPITNCPWCGTKITYRTVTS